MKPGSTPGQASTISRDLFLLKRARYRSRMTDQAARFQNLATRLLRQARLLDEGSKLTSAQYSALSTLYSHPGLPLTELAQMEHVSHPTMSRIMSGLIRQGLVVRTPDTKDRRTLRLALTEDGRAAYERVYARRLALIEALIGQLKPETIADLLNALEKLPHLKSS